MSRLTGNEVKDLMEAYNAVYAPQELTEEQVWEEVENWVNSLVEEGYDLSEYTWEEMYEEYIQLNEAIPLAIPAGIAAAKWAIPAIAAGAYGLKGWLDQRQKAQKNTPEEERFLNTGSFAASKDAERRGREAAEINRRQNNPSGKTSRLPSPAQPPARRPLEAKPKPTPTPTPTPSPSKPPSKPPSGGGKGPNWNDIFGKVVGTTKTGQGVRGAIAGTTAATDIYGTARYGDPSWGLRVGSAVPAAASLPPHLVGLTGHKGSQDLGRALWDPLNAGQGTSPDIAGQMWKQPWRKPAASTAAPSSSPKWYDQVKENQSYDLFDVIKGHLLDEGYADTEEAALKIMVNMSEEWKEDIIESIMGAFKKPVERKEVKKPSVHVPIVKKPTSSIPPHPSKGTPRGIGWGP